VPVTFRSSFVAAPAASVFPDATNTGVQSGVSLTNSGNFTTSANNQVISGLNITIPQGSGGAGIIVAHNNVTITNCKITGMGCDVGIYMNNGTNGLTVSHCEIFGTPGVGLPDDTTRTAVQLVNGIRTDDNVSIPTNTEISFCNIYGVENCICSLDSYIHDNYFHDMAYWTGPNEPGGDTHVDCIQTFDASNIGGMRIVHNTIYGIATMGMFSPATATGASSCCAFSQNQHDLTIDNNLVAGGGFSFQGNDQTGASSPVNTRITNNRFSRLLYSHCGNFGIFSGFDPAAPGYIFSGNVWHETGLPVFITD
jgi:hypothetical protein